MVSNPPQNRPVVLNRLLDISLVPIEDLPLQTTLYFAPCPAPLAVSYLQLRSWTEGLNISAALVSRLYAGLEEHTARQEQCSDDTIHPRWIPQSAPDFRRTINQLQFGIHHPCELRRSPSENWTQDRSLQMLGRIALSLELSSFVDGGLRRPASEVMRVGRLHHIVQVSLVDLLIGLVGELCVALCRRCPRLSTHPDTVRRHFVVHPSHILHLPPRRGSPRRPVIICRATLFYPQ